MTESDRHLMFLPLCFTGGFIPATLPVFHAGATLAGSAYATRTSELTKIKGELVNPETIKDRVARVPGVIEYQVVMARRTPPIPSRWTA